MRGKGESSPGSVEMIEIRGAFSGKRWIERNYAVAKR